MQNIETLQPSGILGKSERDRIPSSDELLSTTRAERQWLQWVAWLLHAVCGSAFSLATGFTGRFLLLTHFWIGAAFGGIAYVIIYFVLGSSDTE
jgi:hypothetical protein